MAVFERDQLIKALSPYLKAVDGIPNDQVGMYLQYYQLHELLNHSTYKIGRMMLDDVTVTIQAFSQPSGELSRGTVIVIHGYMDHVGLYKHLISTLLASRFNVLCYDLSGHGLSDGDPLLVDDFKHYATQLAELIKIVGRDITYPLHLIGQSTGAAVVMAHQLLFPAQKKSKIGARVLLAPLIRPTLWRSIERRFRWFKYVLKRVPRRYSGNSHDAAFRRFIAEDDLLQHTDIPVRWIGAMLAWGDWVESHQPVNGSIYMIQGTDDGTVDWRHNMAVLGRLYPDLELTLIEDAKHHLVNETPFYRSQVFNQLDKIFQNWESENNPPIT